MSGRAFLTLANAAFRLGDRIVFPGTSWVFHRGEHWAVVGPNGGGKSLLGEALRGRLPLAQGELRYHFRPPPGLSAEGVIGHVSFEDRKREVQERVVSGLHDTVGLFRRPSRRQRAAARRWLERFGLREYARRPLNALSAGLQRMVLLARALVKAPELLVLDEPCQGLDAAHREVFVSTVDELIGRKLVTAIYVTHRADEIPPSVQRVLRLRRP